MDVCSGVDTAEASAVAALAGGVTGVSWLSGGAAAVVATDWSVISRRVPSAGSTEPC